MIYSLNAEEMAQLYERISKEFETYGTVDIQGDITFSRIESYDELRIGRSDKPPKEFLIGRNENVLVFTEPNKKAVFGVMSCDLKGFYIMDKQIYGKDPFYTARRDNTVFINYVCTEPCETGFCSSFGGPLLNDYQIQVINYENDKYLIYADDAYKSFFEGFKQASKEEISKVEKLMHNFNMKHKKHEVVGIENRIKWNSKLWDEYAKICIQCGACNYSCPTCYCFDLNDVGEERIREWDSCILAGFTKTSAGNPRESLASRLRQRFYHKFVYYKKSKGEYLCTGCNRCTDDCPVDIEIKEVIDHDYNNE